MNNVSTLPVPVHDRFTVDTLTQYPLVHQGHTDNLYIEVEGVYRVWLSRMTVADGMPYDNQITEEICVDGKWSIAHQYPG